MSEPDTDYQVGELVNVVGDCGDVRMYEVKYPPWKLDSGRWVIGLHGIAGGYALDRVRKIRPPGGSAERIAELERERDELKLLCAKAASRLAFIRNGVPAGGKNIDPAYCLGNEDMILELRKAARLDESEVSE